MDAALSRLKSHHILSGFIVILSSALLVGARFHATWAGGDGLLTHANANLVELVDAESGAILKTEDPDIVTRGETMHTDKGDWKQYAITTSGKTTHLYLDENTDLKIISSSGSTPVFEIVQGRAVIEGQATINARDMHVRSNGTTSFTFYSWLDVLDVSQTKGTLDVLEGAVSQPVPSSSFRLDTLPPYDPAAPFIFNPESSSAASFYAWSLNHR